MSADPNADPYQAKRPRSLLAGLYGHPTHPVLVTLPIGAWTSSLVFDLASRRSSDQVTFAKGSQWLIGLGAGGAMVAAVPGFLDYLTIPKGTKAKAVALTHLALNVGVSAAYAANLRWRQSSAPKDGVADGPLLLSAASLAALGVSGFLGGKLAHTYGVRVADEATQAAAFQTRPDLRDQGGTEQPPGTSGEAIATDRPAMDADAQLTTEALP